MILIVEDDKENLHIYQRTIQLVQAEFQNSSPIHSATTFEEALTFFSEECRSQGKTPQLVIVDMEIPRRGHKDPKAGYLLIRQLHSQFPETAWLPITAHIALQDQYLPDEDRTLLDALYAFSSWGIHYKDKISNMESMLRRFFASRQQKPSQKNGETGLPGVYGVTLNGEQFVTLDYGFYSEIRSVAEDGRHVVVFGKRGTGKRLTARLLHHFSRRQGQFLVVDGIAEEADLNEQLFPTTTTDVECTTRSCTLEQCRGGTLYIRNFDQMPKPIQRRILHFLRYRDYDVRLVGGICQSRKEFRNYERILPDFMDTMIPLDLPTLAERREDIPVLVRIFIEQFNRRRTSERPQERHPPKDFVDADRISQLLVKQDWSGSNIAGLRMVVEEVLLKTPAPIITPEDFKHTLATLPRPGVDMPREVTSEEFNKIKPVRVVVTNADVKRNR